MQQEFPNQLAPRATRGLSDILECAERIQKLLRSQRYEVLHAVTSAEKVALEVQWTGTLAIPLAGLAPDGVPAGPGSLFSWTIGLVRSSSRGTTTAPSPSEMGKGPPVRRTVCEAEKRPIQRADKQMAEAGGTYTPGLKTLFAGTPPMSERLSKFFLLGGP